MKRDVMLPGDTSVFSQDFPDTPSAVKLCHMIKKICKDTECHVRIGKKVVAKTQLSSNAWTMTFLIVLIQLKRMGIEPPTWFNDIVYKNADCSRRRQSWYLKDADGNRISCRDFLNEWGAIIGLGKQTNR